MNRIAFRTLTLICAGTAAWLGLRTGRWTFTAPPNRETLNGAQGPLEIASDQLHLGVIPESLAHLHHFDIKNVSDKQLWVVRFERSCDCLSLKPEGEIELAPGGGKRVELQLRTNIDAAALRNVTERHLKLIAIVADGFGGEVRQNWQLAYRVSPTISIEPQDDRFPTHSVLAGMLDRQFRIALAPEVARIEVASHPNWQFSQTESSGRTVVLNARYKSPQSAGSVADTVVVAPVGRNGQRYPSKQINIQGQISQDTVAVPHEIHVGRVRVGSIPLTESVRITSLTSRKVKLVSASGHAGEFEVNLSGADSEVCEVTIRPTQAGSREGQVKLRVRDDTDAESEVVVPVRYLGY